MSAPIDDAILTVDEQSIEIDTNDMNKATAKNSQDSSETLYGTRNGNVWTWSRTQTGGRRRSQKKGGRKSKKCSGGKKSKKQQKGGKRRSQKKGGKRQQKKQQKQEPETM